MNESLAKAAAAYKSRHVLVTGASGFIGGSLVAALADAGCFVRRHSRRILPPLDGLRARIEDVHGDPHDPGLWRDAVRGIDVIFHCAAQTSAYAAVSDPASDLRANAEFPLLILEAARVAGTRPTFVLASTATVVGMPANLPVDETHKPNPMTAYDMGKWVAENYLELYVRLGHVTGAALRLANVYGPGAGSSSPDRGVLNQVIRLASSGKPIVLYGDGNWTRDYVFIDDVAAAFLLTGLTGARTNGKAFFVCSGTGVTVAAAFRKVVEIVRAQTGRDTTISQAPLPEGLLPIEFRNFVGRWDALAQATGWRPTTDFDDGIARTVAAFCSPL